MEALNLWQNRQMLVTETPCALLWPAAMMTWGPGFKSSSHKHHSVQLVMALDGSLRVRSGPGHRWIKCGAALVKPDVFHQVEAEDVHVLIAFVDPESDLGAALLETIDLDISPVLDGTVSTWRRDLGEPEALTASRVEPWVRKHLLSGRRAPRIHPAVRRVLKTLRAEIGPRSSFPLRRLAQIAKLSPSRLMHVFHPVGGSSDTALHSVAALTAGLWRTDARRHHL